MARQTTTFAISVTELAAGLLAQREVVPRAQFTADQTAQLLPGTSVTVYVIPDQENPVWTAKASTGEVACAAEVEFHAGTLGALAETRSTVLLKGSEVPRESYSHLDTRRQVAFLAYVPLLVDATLIGAIEMVQHEESFPEAMLDAVHEIAHLASPALAASLNYESERNASLQSISRVTQMYDLEKVFNSTLEMDELLAIIAKKFQEMMGVQGINLWMINQDLPELLNQAGWDPTVEIGAAQKPGEGVVGDISDTGESVLIADPEDERLKKRNAGREEGTVFSLLAVPLLEHEKLVGVVEAVNRVDGAPFDEDDQFLFINICETASNALHNASLLQAERKVEILQTLVRISGEITSTLNLDRVLQAVVNGPSTVIPHERSAIALEQRGRLQLKALSGMEQINPEAPDVDRLNRILQWASMLNEELFVSQTGDEVKAAREETREKFHRYFAESGMRAFYAVPLLDDEGRLGILSFESSDPDFLTDAHLEMIKVIAGQATVALRNASLYQEVPFIGVLEPLLQRKAKFMALPGRRRAAILTMAAAAVIFLGAVPMPMRVEGSAVVAPARKAQIQPEVDGVVRNVYVHEGDSVEQGSVVADLEDWEYRGALSAAQAKYESAQSEANRALAANDGEQAGIQRVAAQYWAAEVRRLQERWEKTRLRSPISGKVLTPHPENLVGRKLTAGDEFIEVADSSQAVIDVAIDESDIPLVRTGTGAAVKLESYPQRTFHGAVGVVSPQGQVEQDERVFYARVNVPNTDGLMRPGMQGRGKVSVGWRPVGVVFLRRPVMWIYSQLWSWLGW
ncbi:MAG TPA: efflux RND transporter periplasmic adaptor subunit [Candidatus Acidoferrales bacterium]|nr:efflux RND transporter periplasmic adaptor subunit [Candidatus Acidoferrales bacterium]